MERKITNYYIEFAEDDNEISEYLENNDLIAFLKSLYGKADPKFTMTSERLFIELEEHLFRSAKFLLFVNSIKELLGLYVIDFNITVKENLYQATLR